MGQRGLSNSVFAVASSQVGGFRGSICLGEHPQVSNPPEYQQSCTIVVSSSLSCVGEVL